MIRTALEKAEVEAVDDALRVAVVRDEHVG
jgi:hypothetical protein